MPLHAGGWVQTRVGYSGKILLVGLKSVFVDIKGHDEMRAKPYLLSDLVKDRSARHWQKRAREGKDSIVLNGWGRQRWL